MAEGLSAAFADASKPLRVAVECDTGMGRAGVQTPAAAVELAQKIARLPGLQFAGLMTFPIADGTRPFFEAALAKLKHLGLAAEMVSTGGTPQYPRAHEVPGITEHRAGTCVRSPARIPRRDRPRGRRGDAGRGGAAREFHRGEAHLKIVDPVARAAVTPPLASGANES